MKGFREDFRVFRRIVVGVQRDGREARAIRQQLARRGVRSVYLSDKSSVFDSQEAADVLAWLRACAEPDDEHLLRAALATVTLGRSLSELHALTEDELAWEARVMQFRGYRQQWRRQGVLPMLRHLMQDFALPQRLMAGDDGERALTNLLHLAELLQQAAGELDGEQALIRHLAEHLDGQGQGAEEQILRLESDDALVRVVTIHKSKGLEYPLVFCPYLWDGALLRQGEDITCHAEDGTPLLDLGGEQFDKHRAVARRDLDGFADELGGRGIPATTEIERLERLAAYLDAYGVGGACAFDAAIVRGLAYYTGVVFEMYDRRGELRALCGGGRFDDLLAAAGGEDLPAVGFGLGEAVLLELLAERGRSPKPQPWCDLAVFPVGDEDRTEAIRVATRLRAAGLNVDLALKHQSLGRGLKRAAQAGARAAVVIGAAEREARSLTVRDLASGEERPMDVDALVAWAIERRSGCGSV